MGGDDFGDEAPNIQRGGTIQPGATGGVNMRSRSNNQNLAVNTKRTSTGVNTPTGVATPVGGAGRQKSMTGGRGSSISQKVSQGFAQTQRMGGGAFSPV